VEARLGNPGRAALWFAESAKHATRRSDIVFSADGKSYSESETFTNDVPVAGRAATLGPFENPAAKVHFYRTNPRRNSSDQQ